jgi:hypothetical protein
MTALFRRVDVGPMGGVENFGAAAIVRLPIQHVPELFIRPPFGSNRPLAVPKQHRPPVLPIFRHGGDGLPRDADRGDQRGKVNAPVYQHLAFFAGILINIGTGAVGIGLSPQLGDCPRLGSGWGFSDLSHPRHYIKHRKLEQ